MIIYVPKETDSVETRVPLIPEHAARLIKRGADVVIESEMGAACGYSNDDYTGVGAHIAEDARGALASADMVLRLGKPSLDDARVPKSGCIHVSYLDPFNEHELTDALIETGISVVSMEMIPRTTLAQKMDALSSQANLAGYTAVVVGADHLDIALPMMMTPAGTLKPARVFVIGCGVAGLQAIATAKRLGARVDAFDTRPVVEEQVQSLGAKFVKVDLGETGETKDGYAKELTDEQREKQKAAMAKVCAQADLVITTAQLFGRKAPVIVTDEMIASMRPGSVIVDLAVETGGNVEGARPGEVVDAHGVQIVGLRNMPGRVARHASQMYSANLVNLVEHFWDDEAKSFTLNFEDEILDGCMIAHAGELRNEMIKNARSSR